MKLIAMDYDGTLKYDKKVNDRDLAALNRWHDAGNLLVIDTGRSMESILEEAKKYQLYFDYYVTNNGGMLFDKEHHCLFSSYLPNDLALKLMRDAKEMDGLVSFVANDGFYRHCIVVNDQLEEHRYPGVEPNMSEEEVFSLGKYAQLVLSFSSKELAAKMEKVLRESYDQIEAFANKYVVDVVPKGISKARGVQLVCEREGIAIEDTYTIGDADNDIALIEFGVNGCVMSLASDDIKKYAKYEYVCVGELIDEVLG